MSHRVDGRQTRAQEDPDADDDGADPADSTLDDDRPALQEEAPE